MGQSSAPVPGGSNVVAAALPFWRSKTFWGAIVVIWTPVVIGAINGALPDATHLGQAIGASIAAAGFRDQMGRIEGYVGQLIAGSQSATPTITTGKP